MTSHHNDDREDALKRAIRAYHAQGVPEGPPDEFVAEVVAALHHAGEAASASHTSHLKERIFAMKRTTKLTIAATFLLVISGLTAWLTPARSTALAFDRVAEAMANIRTATCVSSSETILPDGKIMSTTTKHMFATPSRERCEMTRTGLDTTIIVTDYRQGKQLFVSTAAKTARIITMENLPTEQRFSQFEQLQKLIADAKNGPTDMVEPLGLQLIDGRKLATFRLRSVDDEYMIWTDPETGLPVRFEITYDRDPKHPMVISDYRFNMELDESLFSLEPPEGYTVSEETRDASEKTVEDLIHALRRAAEYNDGIFPPELYDEEGLQSTVMTFALARHGEIDATDTVSALVSEMAEVLEESKAARGAGFVRCLPPESDYHYAGKDVKLDTPDRPIFWYKPKGSETYRVIYADLSIKDVEPGELDERAFRRK